LREQGRQRSFRAEDDMSLETIEREQLVKGLTPKQLYDVVTDYSCYPRIFPEFTGAQVLSTTGTTRRVEFRATVGVVKVRYTLDIVHDDAACKTEWTFVEGEVVSDSKGGWHFVPEGADTRIRYHAGIAIRAPLPKFVINKISNALMGTSIPNMLRSLEREAPARAQVAR
jgi:ribosome-associated toxin RatA of RatAB toxin-antitoxin module